ncbi:MAG: glycosyltransferase family 2 protein [Methylotenera sp.]
MSELMLNQMQDNLRPLVTVAMPVYNAGKYLRLAVLSIIRQTFTDWEMLIIDDGSTDDAFDSIADIQDERIRILRDDANKGLAARLNEAIDLARGQYFARMDQDDVSYPERFERQVQLLQNEHELDLVAVRAITISGNNELTGMLACTDSNEEISAKPWRGFYLPHPTWMGKIAWFRKNRYANPGPFFCEDQELLLRTYDKSRFSMIMEPLFAYRIRDSINWQKLIKTRLTVLKIQLHHFMDKGQLYFSIMAVSSFIGRIILDALKGISLISYPIIKIRDKEITTKWQGVLNYIGCESR